MAPPHQPVSTPRPGYARRPPHQLRLQTTVSHRVRDKIRLINLTEDAESPSTSTDDPRNQVPLNNFSILVVVVMVVVMVVLMIMEQLPRSAKEQLVLVAETQLGTLSRGRGGTIEGTV